MTWPTICRLALRRFYGSFPARLPEAISKMPGRSGDVTAESTPAPIRRRRNPPVPVRWGCQLAGPASYFGKRVEKPTIGDALREVEPEDILRTNRMMVVSSVLGLVLGLAIHIAIVFSIWGPHWIL